MAASAAAAAAATASGIVGTLTSVLASAGLVSQVGECKFPA